MNKPDEAGLTWKIGYRDLLGFAVVAIGTWGLLGALAVATSCGLQLLDELSKWSDCRTELCTCAMERFEDFGDFAPED